MIKDIAIILAYQLMLLASLPAISQYIRDRSLGALKNYRLARTCLFAMLLSGGMLYGFLYFYQGNISEGMNMFIIASALYFALTFASYAEAIFDCSVRNAEQIG